ncbi:PF06966 family protein [Leptospira inadai serovar Lyme str. 10]|uniref:PF06966 family protein n=2 Tax=Leptospira inadai serovar Lyme TaxID=293084 RepID=V6HBK4_9LEPT|nr:DUF1295 domain-containing protein [Leptospira inadai]EQA36013.1 PF06966 family protein [Leptospira inadai serovar Lyme str. 10]PNV76796.1 DUF1295 domain-containing protein [Leptospira inadai serovar Lyme]
MYENALFLIFTAWAVVFALMSFLWLIGKVIRNYSIVDMGWGLCISTAAIIYFVLGDGYPVRKAIFAFMATVWGWRLSYFILVTRVLTGHEDPRYSAFRTEYGEKVDRKFFTNVFQFQGALGTALSLPFIFPALNASTAIHPLEIFGLVFFAISVLGESISDSQLADFKLNPLNRGKVCDVGLWRYSRHPNYFFEWSVWVSFGLVSLASPWGWIGLLSPIVMFLLLTQITGIPLNEEGQLKSKGQAYREYRERTSSFFPWFPKK